VVGGEEPLAREQRRRWRPQRHAGAPDALGGDRSGDPGAQRIGGSRCGEERSSAHDNVALGVMCAAGPAGRERPQGRVMAPGERKERVRVAGRAGGEMRLVAAGRERGGSSARRRTGMFSGLRACPIVTARIA